MTTSTTPLTFGLRRIAEDLMYMPTQPAATRPRVALPAKQTMREMSRY